MEEKTFQTPWEKEKTSIYTAAKNECFWWYTGISLSVCVSICVSISVQKLVILF